MQVRRACTPCGGGALCRCECALQHGEQLGVAVGLGNRFLTTCARADTTLPYMNPICIVVEHPTALAHNVVCLHSMPSSLFLSRAGGFALCHIINVELLKPPRPVSARQVCAGDQELTPAPTTALQVLSMVGSVAAGAVLIAGLNANTAVRSAHCFRCPVPARQPCWLTNAHKPWPRLICRPSKLHHSPWDDRHSTTAAL